VAAPRTTPAHLKERIKMRPGQRDQILRLGRCRLNRAGDKQSLRTLAGKPDGYVPSPAEAQWLDALCHRYRRQLAAQIVGEE
jgi:hypothetical protein